MTTPNCALYSEHTNKNERNENVQDKKRNWQQRAWNGNCNYKERKKQRRKKPGPLSDCWFARLFVHLTSCGSRFMLVTLITAVAVNVVAAQCMWFLSSIHFFSLMLKQLHSHVLCCRSCTMQLHTCAHIHKFISPKTQLTIDDCVNKTREKMMIKKKNSHTSTM